MAQRWKTGLLGLAAVTLGSSAAAAANECVFCDRIVVLDKDLAACLAAQYDARVKELDDDKKPFLLVDLGNCAGKTDTEKGPVPRSQKALKSSFILDKVSLMCLKSRVEAVRPEEFDPQQEFNLKTCPR